MNSLKIKEKEKIYKVVKFRNNGLRICKDVIIRLIIDFLKEEFKWG